jgi:hypothetical protein
MRKKIAERTDFKGHLLETEAAMHSSLLPAADRARAELSDAKRASERMLRGISPIGETSPVEAELSFA